MRARQSRSRDHRPGQCRRLRRRRQASRLAACRARPTAWRPAMPPIVVGALSHRIDRAGLSAFARGARARARRPPRANSTCAPRRSPAASTRRWPPRRRSRPATFCARSSPPIRICARARRCSPTRAAWSIASEPARRADRGDALEPPRRRRAVDDPGRQGRRAAGRNGRRRRRIRRRAQPALDLRAGRVRRAGERNAARPGANRRWRRSCCSDRPLWPWSARPSAYALQLRSARIARARPRRSRAPTSISRSTAAVAACGTGIWREAESHGRNRCSKCSACRRRRAIFRSANCRR